MELPYSLRAAIDTLTAHYDIKQLTRCAEALTERYTNKSGTGSRLVTADEEAAAYAAVRMPATYAAVYAALSQAPERPIQTVLDAGAGTGAASWAACMHFSPDHMTCLEREPAMRKAGKTLAQDSDTALSHAEWRNFDMTAKEPLPKADLVMESYMLNEMTEENRLQAAESLWSAADQLLLLIEPGTPVAAAQLNRIRSRLLSLGAHIAAPCPSEGACPIDGDDWCHFRTRVARSRLHKQLKGGDVPYEDEKFSYLLLSRSPVTHCTSRIMLPPYIEKGRISLTLCTGSEIVKQTVTKKSEYFKAARKAGCGDLFP